MRRCFSVHTQMSGLLARSKSPLHFKRNTMSYKPQSENSKRSTERSRRGWAWLQGWVGTCCTRLFFLGVQREQGLHDFTHVILHVSARFCFLGVPIRMPAFARAMTYTNLHTSIQTHICERVSGAAVSPIPISQDYSPDARFCSGILCEGRAFPEKGGVRLGTPSAKLESELMSFSLESSCLKGGSRQSCRQAQHNQAHPSAKLRGELVQRALAVGLWHVVFRVWRFGVCRAYGFELNLLACSLFSEAAFGRSCIDGASAGCSRAFRWRPFDVPI